ncbi:MAG: hypothetical protein IKO68_08195 [Oscillospiraceae bacterium]|nr:hypothetical protein [Oscillospiraceae bacterium]
MKKQIFKKDFIIKSHRTGSRLQGKENQVVYDVYTADGTKKVKSGFSRRADADKWLSDTVKIANKLLMEGKR